MNNELLTKETLKQKIKELETEKENMIPNKDKIVKGVYDELNKICDTLSTVESKLKKKRDDGKKVIPE